MDIAQNLTEATNIPEMAVDGIGRLEVHKGRMRVTLMRIVMKDGQQIEEACISLVWSVAAWMDCQATLAQMRSVIMAMPPEPEIAGQTKAH
jgi:hypothetical protein